MSKLSPAHTTITLTSGFGIDSVLSKLNDRNDRDPKLKGEIRGKDSIQRFHANHPLGKQNCWNVTKHFSPIMSASYYGDYLMQGFSKPHCRGDWLYKADFHKSTHRDLFHRLAISDDGADAGGIEASHTSCEKLLTVYIQLQEDWASDHFSKKRIRIKG
ncbi:hypothetical protein BJ138DRAFT_1102131 [Hygrophoropsis aurantiaca]|uniref:Uncharacterized protein n=1 Tax=Hygrophoropsis aurantiaca TaxID=72124 RepID=A0ACB8AAH1_9AGAM|nr:hypothetical protein BJ138DRAFT_1102131 [Hygrophoropsis aurantiaca]